VELPRYLDASLITVDSHPHFVTIVVKGKVLRLRFPGDAEVNSDAGTAKRSATTGDLVLTFPLVSKRTTVGRTGAAAGGPEVAASGGGGGAGRAASTDVTPGAGGAASSRVRRLQPPKKLGDEMMEASSKAVSVVGIVKSGPGAEAMLTAVSTKMMGAAETSATASAAAVSDEVATAPCAPACGVVDDSDVPPLE
jgi:hypothetical protein